MQKQCDTVVLQCDVTDPVVVIMYPFVKEPSLTVTLRGRFVCTLTEFYGPLQIVSVRLSWNHSIKSHHAVGKEGNW